MHKKNREERIAGTETLKKLLRFVNISMKTVICFFYYMKNFLFSWFGVSQSSAQTLLLVLCSGNTPVSDGRIICSLCIELASAACMAHILTPELSL